MIDWSEKDVAAFLKSRAERPYGEDTLLRFRFPVRTATAELRVFPFDERIELVVWLGDEKEEVTRMAFDCERIEFSDEVEEEGGPCLVIHPPSAGAPSLAWICIGRESPGFSILSAAIDKKKLTRRAEPGG